ncbi:MAG TPA: hypothetical protein VG895_04775 [Patescibacteria group bacterium]|nr:hypothetical protein [Patescibacteria group bacterium]
MSKFQTEIYIIAIFQNHEYPFIKIQTSILTDGRKDIRLSFIGTHHHYSFHEAKIIEDRETKFLLNMHNEEEEYPKTFTGRTPIVFTSFDLDKSPSIWDEEIKTIAEKLNLDPDKHTRYYLNNVLPLGDTEERHLGGRKINLKSEKKYPKEKCLFCKIDKNPFNIEIYFVINKFVKPMDLKIKTSLGKIGLIFKY